MGWKSKLSRRRGEKKRRSKSEIGTIRCNYQPSHLKSCLKKRSNNGDDGQSSFSSSSTSFRSGESGPLDQRSSSVQESQRTHLTDSTGSCSYLSRAAFKNVRFHEIEIREYRRTVGDNPSVSMGPPVGYVIISNRSLGVSEKDWRNLNVAFIHYLFRCISLVSTGYLIKL